MHFESNKGKLQKHSDSLWGGAQEGQQVTFSPDTQQREGDFVPTRPVLKRWPEQSPCWCQEQQNLLNKVDMILL